MLHNKKSRHHNSKLPMCCNEDSIQQIQKNKRKAGDGGRQPGGLPWWSSGTESNCQSRETGSIPGREMNWAQLLSLCALGPYTPTKDPAWWNEDPPATKTRHSHINKLIIHLYTQGCVPVWRGLPCWSSGLPLQGSWVWSLVKEPDPACSN